jgi:hypothetical protein
LSAPLLSSKKCESQQTHWVTAAAVNPSQGYCSA